MVCLSIFFCCSLQVKAPAIHVVHGHYFIVAVEKSQAHGKKDNTHYQKLQVQDIFDRFEQKASLVAHGCP